MGNTAMHLVIALFGTSMAAFSSQMADFAVGQWRDIAERHPRVPIPSWLGYRVMFLVIGLGLAAVGLLNAALSLIYARPA